MATFKTPSRNGLRQLNLNDTAGEIWSTRNIDLHTELRKIKLARPLKQVATAATLSNEVIQAFAVTGGASGANTVFALTLDDLYDSKGDFETWAVKDANPQDGEDMTVFNDFLVISTTNNLDAFDITPGGTYGDYTSGWWTARGNPTLETQGDVPRVVEVARIGEETLVVLDGSNVHAYTGAVDSGSGTSVTMDIDSPFFASCFKVGVRSGWVGTFTQENDEAYVFQWDVASTNYTQAFAVGAKAVLAIEMIDDVPLIVTERGEIKLFNNVGFKTIAQFPFTPKPLFLDKFLNLNNTLRPIHPKGMKRYGNLVFINAKWSIRDNPPIDERTHDGIWVLNLDDYSLTHLVSPDNDTAFEWASPLLVLNDSNARLFVGGAKYSAPEEGIWIEDLSDDTEHYGYFVTTEAQAESVKDIFREVVIKALLGDNDEIVVKYRTSNDTGLPVVIEDVAWSSTTEFNSTGDLSYVKTRFDAGNKDEVEILLGSGAGRLAHITNIEKSSSTYTVTIDEAIGTSGETSTIRFDNWKKVPKDYVKTDGEVMRFGIGETGTWCQVKVELRGRAGYPEVRELILKSENKESL